MSTYYFGAFRDSGSGPMFNDGDSPATNTGDWSTLSNWWISPGGVGCLCCCYGQNGIRANTLPTTADTVILLSPLTNVPANANGFSSGVWSGPVRIGGSTQTLNCFSGSVDINFVPDPRNGASPFSSPTWNISGTSIASSVTANSLGYIAGGTFNTPINNRGGILTGGTFNGNIKFYSFYNEITGGTFNGGWDTSTIAGNFSLIISGGTFNTQFPAASGSGYSSYQVTGTASLNWSGDITFGRAGYATYVNLSITTSKNINFLGSNFYLTFSANGNYTGTINIPTSTPKPTISIYGISKYYPPYTTSAIKNGNYMTLNTAAMPIDPGFKIVGGTFSPVINLIGTSNEILGASGL
jgi:hypothetical protein